MLNGELRRDRGEDLRDDRDDVRRGLDRDRRASRAWASTRSRALGIAGIVLACGGFVLWTAQIWGGYDSDGVLEADRRRDGVGARAAASRRRRA